MNRQDAGKDEANCRWHHSLLSQMGQLVERERVLRSENDQLRAQLVDMKRQENKKYDDLMVEYCQLTNGKQVTVKAEWNDEDVKEEMCDGAELVQASNDIHIKREHEQSDNGQPQQMDTNGTSTNTNQVTVKSEWNDADVKTEIKEEVKEEDNYCDRCVVKREMVSDDEEQVDNEGGLNQVGEHNEVGDERYEVIHANLDNGQLLCIPPRDSQNASNSTESIEEGGANLSHEQQMLYTLNEPNDRTVTQSRDSTSTGNATKRKQPPSNRTVKRSKKTLQDDENKVFEDEDIANEDREERKYKMKVLYLNCTQSECNAKLDSLDDLHDHLRTAHQLSSLQCFASNCNARFDYGTHIRDHLKLDHSQSSRFLCPACPKEYDSQMKTYYHWYYNHLNGQFQCNLVSDCAQVTHTRNKMKTHQRTKHHYQPNHFYCTHEGCAASFAFSSLLKQHERIHLDSSPFHCIWPQCNHRTKQRASLLTYIRTQHFGLPKAAKEQKAKNIVEVRDPNQYVRVVAILANQ